MRQDGNRSNETSNSGGSFPNIAHFHLDSTRSDVAIHNCRCGFVESQSWRDMGYFDVGSIGSMHAPRGLHGSVGGFFGNSQRSLHISSLLSSSTLGVFSQGFSGTPELSRIASQYNGGDSQQAGYDDKPPFWRRIPVALFSMFGGAWLYGQGWYHFYKQRRGFGTTQICAGTVLFIFGICLWILLGVRWSWGWWI